MPRYVPAAAALLTFVIHLVANAHYGFFRDELYFIICGQHPQFGYVDQPPLVPLMSAATQMAGHSLFLLRAVPALFAAAGVYTTALLVLEIGGGVFAQILASLAVFFAGVLMNFGMKVSTDEVGLWTWPLIALLVTRIVNGGSPRLWLWAGVAAGVSLQSKYSVIFFLPALVIGLLLTPARRVLFSGCRGNTDRALDAARYRYPCGPYRICDRLWARILTIRVARPVRRQLHRVLGRDRRGASYF
jgi:hypothetical protein